MPGSDKIIVASGKNGSCRGRKGAMTQEVIVITLVRGDSAAWCGSCEAGEKRVELRGGVRRGEEVDGGRKESGYTLGFGLKELRKWRCHF